MKKLYTLIAALVFLNTVQAQITITRSDMPGSGDTIRISNTAAIGIDVSDTGPNHTWDFSSLTPISQDLEEYKSSSSTPYFWLLGKYGRKIADSLGFGAFQFRDIYLFFRNSNSSFKAENIGLRFQGLPLVGNYTDDDEIYEFPLEYGDEDVNTFRAEVGLQAFGQLVQTGTRTNTVDGWGTITTPFGTYDCLRIKTVIDETDSIYTSLTNFGFPNDRVEYKWVAKGIGTPLLQVEGREVLGNFTPTRAFYRDEFRNLPNPLAPIADFEASATTVTTSDVVNFSSLSSNNPNSFTWEFTPNTVTYVNGTNSSSENPVLKFPTPGTYSVSLEVSNIFGDHSEVKTDYITVSPSTGIGELSNHLLKVGPNPAHSQLAIELDHAYQQVALQILDLSGKVVLTEAYDQSQDLQIDVARLAEGSYVLYLQTNDGQRFYQKFVINR